MHKTPLLSFHAALIAAQSKQIVLCQRAGFTFVPMESAAVVVAYKVFPNGGVIATVWKDRTDRPAFSDFFADVQQAQDNLRGYIREIALSTASTFRALMTQVNPASQPALQ